MNITCNSCRFFDGNECRINPPVVIVDGNARVRSMWPAVTRDAWCGQYERLEQSHHFVLGTPLTVEKVKP